MKLPLIFITLIAACLVINSCHAQSKVTTEFGEVIVENSDTAMLHRLMKMNFEKYKGKEVRLILDDLSSQYLRRFFYEGRPGYASFLRIQYSEKLALDVHVRKYEHMNPIDKEYKWDIEKFKKEKVFKIKLRYNRKCIKGCNEEEVDR
ncbi:hypothetical protein A3860_37035 [Niastella vici]|uniref:Uncharacterized protein n=1 Tax=Niastella vici TaxID=1703345 RepID=A0A1V9FMR3_9BACT|nr:hypothetical protein [Niastella vici]OQP59597.1 hypothetical protein A3860_37035 [Niastella vici]